MGVDGHSPPNAVVACVDVGGEALQPVGDELHGAAHDARDDGSGYLVWVDMHLDAVTPTNVCADHADVALRHPHVFGEHALHHVWGLRGVIDGELGGRAVVVGQD